MTAAASVRLSVETLIPVLGQQIRVNVRKGTGVPLVLCNGIGASLEVLDPLVEHLDPDTTVVRFDIPGTGGSPNSPLPYGFPYLAAVLGQLVKKLGLNGKVDVLGFSWGRRAGSAVRVSEPASLPTADPGVHRHRCSHGSWRAGSAGEDADPAPVLGPRLRFRYRGWALRRHCAHRSVPRQAVVRPPADGRFGSGLPSSTACRSGATSLFALPLIRQRTLIVAGLDDPVVPMANARIMARLLPHATVHMHAGGHVDLITNTAELAPVIESFSNVGRFVADAEAIYSYQGTREMNTLIVGRAITGLSAFV
jgi:pimeloyl-ACP methyl ester carboxylesterase